MHFEGPPIAPLLEGQARSSAEPRGLQRVPQRRLVEAIAAGIDLRLGQSPDQRAAAEEAAAEMGFLIRISADIDGQARTGECKRRDDSKRTVEPTGMVLRLEMAARQNVWAVALVAPEHIADAVDGGFEADLGHLVGEP